MNKQIPYIPKQTIDFRPMQYLYCESEPNSKLVTRAAFMRLLEQQPCPMAQVNIDLEGGYAYLFPYCPERAEVFIQPKPRDGCRIQAPLSQLADDQGREAQAPN